MNDAKLLLQKLTILLPPGKGQHHNLTLDEDENLIVGLMLGDIFQHLKLEDNDFAKSADNLASDIYKAVRINEK